MIICNWLIIKALQFLKKSQQRCDVTVVIAIIAILAGMLLPALNNSRESARASNCKSNFKQTGLGHALYAGENDERLAYHGGGGSPWYMKMQDHVGLKGTARTEYYGTTRKVFKSPYICPSMDAKGVLNGAQGDKDQYGSTYTYNLTVAGGGTNWGDNACLAADNPKGIKINSLKEPSSTFVHFEWNFAKHGMPATPSGTGTLYAIANRSWTRVDVPGNYAAAHLHNGMCNVLYVDGHVASVGKTLGVGNHIAYKSDSELYK